MCVCVCVCIDVCIKKIQVPHDHEVKKSTCDG